VGKRVLDLGSNNGVMPLMMLRSGAREVVGLELSPELAELSQLVKRMFEWRDIKKYSFDIRNSDMREILRADWGKFDVVTAFCSLYYLTTEDMAKVVRKASELSPIMVLQAKTDTRPEAAENKAEKSSVGFLRKMFEENGFPFVQVYGPKNYSRPLLVGRVFSG
jgi:cyclopropane fatty-acyl-phospholipid synthase-like methyltransferase